MQIHSTQLGLKEINYKMSIVTFFDIMGFKEVVESAGSPRRVHKILDRFSDEAKPDGDLSEQFDIRFTNFSDSVVRSINVLSESNQSYPVGLLFYELIDLVHIQLELVNFGVLIRGGLCIEEIYHENPFVFGPGMNLAYKLESEKAVYPRIVLTEKTLAHLADPIFRNVSHDEAMEREYVDRLIRDAGEGLYFIDYLRVAWDEVDEASFYLIFLEKHKSLVVNGYKTHSHISSVAAKYQWLAEYHNDTVSVRSGEIEMLGADPANYLVAQEDVPTEGKLFVGNESWRPSA